MDDSGDKLILFGPVSGKSLTRAYPELKLNKTFEDLPNDELLFAWYMGCRSSPIDENWNESVRAKQAAWQCFPRGHTKREQFASMEIPVSVKEAIEEMRKYSPETRMQALRANQLMFHNIIASLKIDVSVLDLEDRKKYVEMCSKAADTLPVVLKYLEEGFGIKETKKKSEELRTKPIDEFHQNKKENK